MIDKTQLLERYTDTNGVVNWLEISRTKGLDENLLENFKMMLTGKKLANIKY